MSDVGERPAVNECRVVFQRLHEVRLHRILQEHGHRAVSLDVTAEHRRAITAIGDDHVAEAFLQVLEIRGQAEDRHHLGCHRDVKTALSRESVRHASKRQGHLPQGTVVHVNHATPRNTANVNVLRIAPVDVIVDHRGQQRVCRSDGVEISGEMKIHVFHRNDLRITTTSGSALHPEVGPERGLANADHRLLANGIQSVAKTDGRRGLSLSGGCRVHGGDQNELAVPVTLDRVDELLGNLGLVMAIREKVRRRNAQLVTYVLYRFLLCCACDFNVRHFSFLLSQWL